MMKSFMELRHGSSANSSILLLYDCFKTLSSKINMKENHDILKLQHSVTLWIQVAERKQSDDLTFQDLLENAVTNFSEWVAKNRKISVIF